jgi:hypothetical protein
MIPVYEAIEFKGEMVGGSTRPWQVTVLQEGEPVSYIVKLYTEANNEQNCTVLKECICSVLAREFDLKTPTPALIEFNADFIANLPTDIQSILQQKDQRIKFASRLVQPPYQNYSPALKEEYLQTYDLGTIYAFDNLILNVDRRTEKPNMFFKEGDVVLIDHELTLVTTHNARNSLINNTEWPHNYQRHLFHPILSDMELEGREACFDTFSYYLRDLVDFDDLDRVVEQLVEYGHPVETYLSIRGYFKTAQQHSERFVNLIEGTLQ